MSPYYSPRLIWAEAHNIQTILQLDEPSYKRFCIEGWEVLAYIYHAGQTDRVLHRDLLLFAVILSASSSLNRSYDTQGLWCWWLKWIKFQGIFSVELSRKLFLIKFSRKRSDMVLIKAKILNYPNCIHIISRKCFTISRETLDVQISVAFTRFFKGESFRSSSHEKIVRRATNIEEQGWSAKNVQNSPVHVVY